MAVAAAQGAKAVVQEAQAAALVVRAVAQVAEVVVLASAAAGTWWRPLVGLACATA
jgi:hypothetical protein